MKKQCYMTAGERHQLEAMRRNKIPIAEIARQLNRSRQTIYNELRRGSYLHTVDYQDVVRYSADKGQAIRELASKCKGRRIKTENDADYMDFLEYMILKGKYSPAAALAEARAVGYTTTICVTTLYSYISKRRFPRLRDMDLLEKVSRRHRKKSEEPRIVHKDYPSIEVRGRTLGDGFDRWMPWLQGCAAHADRAPEPTGDHYEASGSESGDDPQGHRSAGAQNATVPAEVPQHHHRQRQRISAI